MSEAKNRKTNDWIYNRETERYKKSLARWQNFQIVGGLTIAGGVVIVAFAVNEYTRLDLTGMLSMVLVGLATGIVGLIPWWIGKQKIQGLEYKAAINTKTLLYLKVLGITEYDQVLEDNPIFRKIFQNIKAASIAAYIANPTSLTGLKSVNILARQLRSHLDGGDKTQELKALLFSLMSERSGTVYEAGDYRSLAEFLINVFWGDPGFKGDLMVARQQYFFGRSK